MTLVQNDNNMISGNIHYDNKDKLLLSTSKLNGDSIKIDCLWTEKIWGTSIILTFTGKINSRFNFMNGTYKNNLDYYIYESNTWSANKN